MLKKGWFYQTIYQRIQMNLAKLAFVLGVVAIYYFYASAFRGELHNADVLVFRQIKQPGDNTAADDPFDERNRSIKHLLTFKHDEKQPFRRHRTR